MPRAVDRGRQVDRLASRDELAGFAARKRQQARDQGFHLRGDRQCVVVGAGGAGVRPLESRLGKGTQLGNRRTQFVRHGGAHAPLTLERLFEPREQRIQRRRDGRELARHAERGEARAERRRVDPRNLGCETVEGPQPPMQQPRHEQPDGEQQACRPARRADEQLAQFVVEVFRAARDDEAQRRRVHLRLLVGPPRLEFDADRARLLAVREPQEEVLRLLQAPGFERQVGLPLETLGSCQRAPGRVPELIEVARLVVIEPAHEPVAEGEAHAAVVVHGRECADRAGLGDQRIVEAVDELAAHREVQRDEARREYREQREQQAHRQPSTDGRAHGALPNT